MCVCVCVCVICMHSHLPTYLSVYLSIYIYVCVLCRYMCVRVLYVCTHIYLSIHLIHTQNSSVISVRPPMRLCVRRGVRCPSTCISVWVSVSSSSVCLSVPSSLILAFFRLKQTPSLSCVMLEVRLLKYSFPVLNHTTYPSVRVNFGLDQPIFQLSMS